MGFIPTAAASIYSAVKTSKENKKAEAAVTAANDAEIKKVKDAQQQADDNAAAAIDKRKRAMSQTVFTSPLGISDQASVSRKTLLGQ